jgi:2-haloacid dehalogenase
MRDPAPIDAVKALTFDVFGTVVDWRASIAEEGRALGREKGIDADWVAFADAWRGRYQPSMTRVREGELPWTNLDSLHRASLEELLEEFGISGLDEAEKDHLNRAWHRLDPWPDSVPGLTLLKTKYVLATLSILGAEVARHYKPQPEAYLMTAEFLGLAPHQCMLVAAHNGDLLAAAAVGYRTAFVPRPTEYGPEQKADLQPEHDFDVVAASFIDLADKLGC